MAIHPQLFGQTFSINQPTNKGNALFSQTFFLKILTMAALQININEDVNIISEVKYRQKLIKLERKFGEIL